MYDVLWDVIAQISMKFLKFWQRHFLVAWLPNCHLAVIRGVADEIIARGTDRYVHSIDRGASITLFIMLVYVRGGGYGEFLPSILHEYIVY